LARAEVLERDLNVQKEKFKQFSISKEQFIERLKIELNTVEARFIKIINENNMVGEDYRSQACSNLMKIIQLKIYTKKME
jgi:hypothetical protein